MYAQGGAVGGAGSGLFYLGLSAVPKAFSLGSGCSGSLAKSNLGRKA
jgi:hypothetical protein